MEKEDHNWKRKIIIGEGNYTFSEESNSGKENEEIYLETKNMLLQWRRLTAEERGIWRRLAEKEKEDHLQKAGLSG